jgi:hypothetical protein
MSNNFDSCLRGISERLSEGTGREYKKEQLVWKEIDLHPGYESIEGRDHTREYLVSCSDPETGEVIDLGRIESHVMYGSVAGYSRDLPEYTDHEFYFDTTLLDRYPKLKRKLTGRDLYQESSRNLWG